jgi:hypothetical protein
MTSRQIARTAELLETTGWPNVAEMLREGQTVESLKNKAVILGPEDAATLTALLDAYAEPRRGHLDLSGSAVATAAIYLTGLAHDGCTGHLDATQDGLILVHHGGDSCPVHEP